MAGSGSGAAHTQCAQVCYHFPQCLQMNLFSCVCLVMTNNCMMEGCVCVHACVMEGRVRVMEGCVCARMCACVVFSNSPSDVRTGPA